MTTYDANKYAQRGLGMQDWIDAGRPQYDVHGQELDPAGWPTGKMKDGTSTQPGPAPFDAAKWASADGSHYDPVFKTADDPPKSFEFKPKTGSYEVACAGGAQDGDIRFSVGLGGVLVADLGKPTFSANGEETFTFTCALNTHDGKLPAAVQSRVDDKLPEIARGSYNLYKL